MNTRLPESTGRGRVDGERNVIKFAGKVGRRSGSDELTARQNQIPFLDIDQVVQASTFVVPQYEVGNDERPPWSPINAGPVEFGAGDHEGGSAAASASTRISSQRSSGKRTGVKRCWPEPNTRTFTCQTAGGSRSRRNAPRSPAQGAADVSKVISEGSVGWIIRTGAMGVAVPWPRPWGATGETLRSVGT